MSPLLRPAIVVVSILGLISGSVYLFNFELRQLVWATLPRETTLTAMHLFVLQMLFLYGVYLIVLYLVFKKLNQPGRSLSLLLILLLFGIFFRVCLVGDTPVLSSDIYRYVWDGRVQSRGINPYSHPPASDSLAPLRDKEIFPHINRPTSPTVYPPGAQIFFLLSHGIARDSLSGRKAVLVFFDVLTMIALIGLLRSHGLPPARFTVYAWNPLVIVEIGHSGHLEGLMVFLVVLALYLHSIGKKSLGIVTLASATATKVYPSLLLPCLMNKNERLRGLLIFFSALLIFYLPYWTAGTKIVGFLPTYFKNPDEAFNLGLKYFFMYVFPGLGYLVLTKIFIGILLVAGIIVFYMPKGKEEVIKYSFVLIGLQLIFMPTAMHPWYVVWLISFLAFHPSPAWLVFSGTVVLSYLKYVSETGAMPAWVLCSEYLPLFGFLTVEYFWRQRRRLQFPWRPGGVMGRTI